MTDIYVVYNIFFNNIYSSCDVVSLSDKDSPQYAEDAGLAYPGRKSFQKGKEQQKGIVRVLVLDFINDITN